MMNAKDASSTPLNQPETAPVFIESGAKEPCLDTSHTGIQMLTRIRQLAIYPHGWDGADGKAPSQAAVRDAECFTRMLVHDDVYAPSISLATDGEINFFWMLPPTAWSASEPGSAETPCDLRYNLNIKNICGLHVC